MSVAIHCNPAVEWQTKRAEQFVTGLERLGIDAELTESRYRVSDVAILFGTTFWREVEADGKYLLVDRASYNDPDFVQLVWDGHGRRGDHCVPEDLGDRYEKVGLTVSPWIKGGRRVILCGQTETYSPHYRSLDEWYSTVMATHFRSHPRGANPLSLPRASDWHDCRLAITLNSSVAIEAIRRGIPAVTMDEQAMAWDVTSHYPNEVYTPDRTDWLRWLAWTQWHWDEIESGEPIRHLFEEVL